MIFHHPLPVRPGGTSGSSVRPYRMLEAFRAVGYEVEGVVGFGPERARAIARVREQLRKGRRFDFAYAESSTMPTPLTDPHHVPVRPWMDYAFFRDLARHGVPLGVFYRDVYWRFDHYRREVPWHKRAVSVPFYRHEWQQYRRSVRHLFLPSLEMLTALPTPWPLSRVSALPPGWTGPAAESQWTAGDDTLPLFYVGGVAPPTYDLRPMVDTVARSNGIRLTLCCRPDEWRKHAREYPNVDADRVRVVHAHGEALKPLYDGAAAFLLFRRPDGYLDFAVPVKLFEALGHGLPVITSAGTGAARFVEEEGIGWVVRDEVELQALFARLRERPEDLERVRANVRTVRERHTWEARTRTVADVLAGHRGDRGEKSSSG
jgi:hypothetical protein